MILMKLMLSPMAAWDKSTGTSFKKDGYSSSWRGLAERWHRLAERVDFRQF